jgi:hypothetical protein
MLVEIAIWLLSGYLLVTLAPLIQSLGVTGSQILSP